MSRMNIYTLQEIHMLMFFKYLFPCFLEVIYHFDGSYSIYLRFWNWFYNLFDILLLCYEISQLKCQRSLFGFASTWVWCSLVWMIHSHLTRGPFCSWILVMSQVTRELWDPISHEQSIRTSSNAFVSGKPVQSQSASCEELQADGFSVCETTQTADNGGFQSG